MMAAQQADGGALNRTQRQERPIATRFDSPCCSVETAGLLNRSTCTRCWMSSWRALPLAHSPTTVRQAGIAALSPPPAGTGRRCRMLASARGGGCFALSAANTPT